MSISQSRNEILGVEPIGRLLRRYTVPSVISMLVMSIYNITDQIFIARGVGYLGNAATNVVMPIIMVSMSLAAMVGNGSATFISLELGRGNADKTKRTLGNAVTMIFVAGLSLALTVLFNVQPILRILGTTDNIMPYAVEYTSVLAIGLPFAMTHISLISCIRADGSPRFSMINTLVGVALNVILDPIFIFGMGWGVWGAALATIISQMVGFAISIYYITRVARNIRFEWRNLRPRAEIVRNVLSLGSSSFINQISVSLMATILNNSLAHYGELSSFGADIPLSAMGIVMKINQIFGSTIMGVSVGAQPILGYNYGAGMYDRVKKTYQTMLKITCSVSTCMSILFVTAPWIPLALFHDPDPLFNEFAAHAMRTALCCVFAAGFQIPSSNYFQAVGKPLKAMTLTMSRQLLLLVPAMLILPLFFGLNGVLYAMPVADITATAITAFFIFRELRLLNDLPAATPIPESAS